jgi:ATP-dependent RNA helicase DDX51/DBP6
MKRPFSSSNDGDSRPAKFVKKNQQDSRGSNGRPNGKNNKKSPHETSAGRVETLEERDARKSAAKEEKKWRKELARKRGSSKHADDNEDTNDVADGEHDDNGDDNDGDVDIDVPTSAADLHGKSIVEQLRPSSARDEAKKVKSQKRTDEDEDFNDELFDESVILAPAAPMSVSEAVHSWGLDEHFAQNLLADGIDGFFPVQRAVIPPLLRNCARSCVFPRDMCVSAPTGSGKTIAYALPVLQALKYRTVVRLRALLLLPSRELANQVYRVFCRLARGTDLSIAVCTGQTPLEEEQRLIMGACYSAGASAAPSSSGRGGSGSRPTSSHSANHLTGPGEKFFSNRDLYFQTDETLGNSAVDILICTPGRLLDHIQHTPGFTLRHLRFLVLDEADRLLGNAYHSWVRTLVQSAHSTQSSAVGVLGPLTRPRKDNEGVQHGGSDSGSLPQQQSSDAPSAAASATLPFLAMPQQPLQRLLFSATLTDNPRKLAMLGITNPLIVRAHLADGKKAKSRGSAGLGEGEEDGDDGEDDEDDADPLTAPLKTGASTSGYVLPSTLEESMVVCDTVRRPLLLVSLLVEAFGVPKTLSHISMQGKVDKSHSSVHNVCAERSSLCIVFSSSVETTHRLCRLLQLFNRPAGLSGAGVFGGRVAEMSRLMRSDEREAIMSAAATGDIKVLVSSDHMARGIDLPNIKFIVNYDPPKHAKTYVHRVGRTARANRLGHSLTLLKAGQVGVFRKMRATISTVQPLLSCRLNGELEKAVEPLYATALKHLPEVMEKESQGELAVGTDLL